MGQSEEHEPEVFDLLDSAPDWVRNAGLSVIVDQQILRSHHVLNASPKLHSKPAVEA